MHVVASVGLSGAWCLVKSVFVPPRETVAPHTIPHAVFSFYFPHQPRRSVLAFSMQPSQADRGSTTRGLWWSTVHHPNVRNRKAVAVAVAAWSLILANNVSGRKGGKGLLLGPHTRQIAETSVDSRRRGQTNATTPSHPPTPPPLSHNLTSQSTYSVSAIQGTQPPPIDP